MLYHSKRITGMTLIELLATLAVLTALAGVAIAGLGDLAGRTRQTATVETGSLIRKDIIGNNGSYSAFMSDLGRLPVVLSNDAGKGLGELFNSTIVPAALKYDLALSYTNATWVNQGEFAADYPSLINMSVAFPAGWRGPYYVSTSDELYDGWGNDWQVNIGTESVVDWQDSTDAATLNKPFCGIRSTGRNATADAVAVDWEDEDKTFNFDNNLLSCELTVEVFVKDGGVYVAVNNTLQNRLEAALYAPYATDSTLAIKRILATNTDGVLATQILPAQDVDFPHAESSDWDAFNIVRFSGLSPGIRRLYVFGYLWSGAAVSNGKSSGEQLVDIKPGGNTIKIYLSQDLN